MTKIVLANGEGKVGMAAARQALQANQTALDTVEAGIRPVELDPAVRSVGRGGWANLLGQVELDASIMDGQTLRCGAVGAIKGFLHPISVARRVMEDLPHVFLVGEGAERFAAECGATTDDNLTDDSKSEWQTWMWDHIPAETWLQWPDVPLAEWARLTADPETAGGTTTFLAQDHRQDIAAGVSTCGWAFKYPGRLGDSPIIGAGSYADNRYGAAACTGMGELVIRASTARSVVLYIKMGLSIQDACHEAVADLRALHREYKGNVTIHAIDAQSNPYVVHVGEGKGNYWLWTAGMSKPEEQVAAMKSW